MIFRENKRLIQVGIAILLVLFLVWAALRVMSSSPTPTTTPTTTEPSPTMPAAVTYQYIEVTDSCGPYFDGGDCVNLRSGPGTTSPVVIKLRNGMVLKVASTTVVDGQAWYKIGFDGDVHYPERVKAGWYVSAALVHLFTDPGPVATTYGLDATTTKRIVINLSTETLSAYDGTTLFMQGPISTGLELTPTPVGKFWIRRKMPDSYMQGPIPGLSSQYYDLPGVPWDLYFTVDGAAIHGAYWHNHFGEPWSHGCVNLSPDQAKQLYAWADLGVPVTVVR